MPLHPAFSPVLPVLAFALALTFALEFAFTFDSIIMPCGRVSHIKANSALVFGVVVLGASVVLAARGASALAEV